MTSPPLRFLLTNGVISHPTATPPISTFLETHPGAYTTTRTHNNASFLLFWDRHLSRLANSVQILYNSDPQLLFGPTHKALAPLPPLARLRDLVNDSVKRVLPVAIEARSDLEELTVTALVSGDERNDGGIGVSVYVGSYVPLVFGDRGNGARLAVVGRGRDFAAAKYSDWVRIRKPLERLRPPFGTELLLSNDGDKILEGSVSNFFVVCQKVILHERLLCQPFVGNNEGFFS